MKQSTCAFFLMLLAYTAQISGQEKLTQNTDPNATRLYQGKTVDEWIPVLRDKDSKTRVSACYALESFGERAKSALPALTEALKDPEIDWCATAAILAIKPEPSQIVPKLTELFGNQKSQTRIAAAELLGKLGPKALAAESALIELLKDSDKGVRVATAYSLTKMSSPQSKAAIPILILELKNENTNARGFAAMTLGELTLEPKVAIPALVKALKEEKTPCRYYGSMAFYSAMDVHRAIAEALRRFGKEAVPSLIETLSDSNVDVRWSALLALRGIGSHAGGASDAIIKYVNDKDVSVRELALSTLYSVGTKAEIAVPLLQVALKDSRGTVRVSAAEELGHYGSKAKDAIPRLLEMLDMHHDVGGSKCMIGEAINSIDPETARKHGLVK